MPALPMSEGTANKLLRGKTDDEILKMFGKPDHTGAPGDGSTEMMWTYTAEKYIKPPISYETQRPGGMFVYLHRGQVVRIAHRGH
ncbi:MAG TPA: hypothetical protein VGE74_25015 [Gemmata sp.]